MEYIANMFKYTIYIIVILTALCNISAVYSEGEDKNTICDINERIGKSTNEECSGNLFEGGWYGMRRKKALLAMSNNENEVFQAVFESLGYEVDLLHYKDPLATPDRQWDVLWSDGNPWFTKNLKTMMGDMSDRLKVNHIPGTYVLTKKSVFSLSGLKEVPKSFLIPMEKQKFLDYVQSNSSELWVKKHPDHRGVSVVRRSELDLNAEQTYLVQEYIDDPLLIEGKRFDVGLYTAITSVKPLRAYIYNNDWRIKFCKKKYHPFDLRDQEKFVVKDPIGWKGRYVAGIENYLKYLYTGTMRRREALMLYLKEKGYDTSRLVLDIHNALRSMIKHGQEEMLRQVKLNYKADRTVIRKLFEMMRVDFIIDNNMKVHMIESNMSPEMYGYSDGSIEQILYGLFNLVGIADPLIHSDVNNITADMQVSLRELQVFREEVLAAGCNSSCKADQICDLYVPCMSEELQLTLRAAYMEHVNKHGYTRIWPKPFQSRDEAKKSRSELTDFSHAEDWVMAEWFRGKCLEDISWC